MPEHPPDPPPGSEEPRTISDQQMVLRAAEDPPLVQQMTFTSEEASSTSLPSKKMARKSLKTNVKERKSTPAPSTKGDGRKRFVLSPMPEDKQLRKKIDFGAEGGSPVGSPKCKTTIFPAPPGRDMKVAPPGNEAEIVTYDEGDEKIAIVLDSYDYAGEIPSSGQDSGDGRSTVEASDEPAAHAPPPPHVGPRDAQLSKMVGEVILPNMDKGTKPPLKSSFVPYPPNKGVTCAAKNTLKEGVVNLPEMELGTKSPFESALVPYHNGGSRELLAVEAPIQPQTHELIHLATLDSAETLDTMAAQPLIIAGPPETGSKPYVARASRVPRLEPPGSSPSTDLIASLEEFPPLEKGRTLKIRDTFEKGSPSRKEEMAATNPKLRWGSSVPQGTQPKAPLRLGYGVPSIETSIPMVIGDSDPETSNNYTPPDLHGPNQQTPGTGMGPSTGLNHANLPKTHEPHSVIAGRPITLAEVLKGSSDPNGPQVFEPEKIQNIGFASASNGIPTIYFSGAETRKLAEGIGHAIVGKFSHSIPTGHQIQKALDNIKLSRGFNWKYINAKHILIQCEDIGDYARLLGGPRGSPVWFIDRHPMRVFKWSPEFDAYCESPIAAIWCNLIGLPIHLYDQSALFAIGKLLGTPIQIDRATANKSRLSFARICIEIDITKPPPEEIILDLCGRETVQQVRWDKIPSYCQDCKHVGHTREVCYATGKKERPAKRNYNIGPLKQPHSDDRGVKHMQDTGGNDANPNDANPNEWKRQGKKKNSGADRANYKAKGTKGADTHWQGPDILGDFNDNKEASSESHRASGTRNGREASSHLKGFKPFAYPLEEATPGVVNRGSAVRGGNPVSAPIGPSGSTTKTTVAKSREQEKANCLSTNQYFSLMEDEEYEDGDHDANESFERGAHNSDDAGGASNPTLEAETDHEWHDQQMTDFRGWPSHPPGTEPHC